MKDLISQYKGDLSNHECIKQELQNVIDELENVNRLKVTEQFANEILNDIKSIRLLIQSITD